MTDITLTTGDDSYTYTRTSSNDTVLGLAGNDSLTVISSFNVGSVVTLDGGAGDDNLTADNNPTILIGGSGFDVANLPVYNASGGLQLSTDAQGRYVISNIYGGTQLYTIDPSIEQVRFNNYYYSDYSVPPSVVNYADLPKYVGTNNIRADYSNSQTQHIEGTGKTDVAYFNGATGDYTYSQLPSFVDPITGQARAGTIVFVATNGSGSYTISSNVEYVHFVDGQLLDFSALPGALAASPAPTVADRTIFGDYSGSHIYLGGAGNDTLTLNGAIKDYYVKPVTAYAANAPETGVANGQAINGIELIAVNGSGVYVVDPSIEQVQFNGGDGVVAYGALTSRVTAAPATTTTDTLHLNISGAEFGTTVFGGDSFDDRALLNTFYGGTLTRDAAGDFILTSYYSNGQSVVLQQSLETVQLYAGGPVLALGDLPKYFSGDPTFTGTTVGNDILFNALSGDQYLIGGAGIDTAYLSGNVGDYAIAVVNQAATATTPAVNGFELVSFNGSGNIFVDRTTETVHMQNGTAFATADLPSFVTQHYAAGGVGTSQDDVFFQNISGDQRFVGSGGTDTVYLRGNTTDYSFSNVSTPAMGTTPATQGVLLHALNGSGDLYIDSTTESAHFANGLYASYAGLQSFG